MFSTFKVTSPKMRFGSIKVYFSSIKVYFSVVKVRFAKCFFAEYFPPFTTDYQALTNTCIQRNRHLCLSQQTQVLDMTGTSDCQTKV